LQSALSLRLERETAAHARKAGVARAGTDPILQPAACRATPDGNILIADGHWPRPTTAQQYGDRLVWFTRDGKFIKEFGRHGRKPGEFMGPHGLAVDSKGRLFVVDRSNNRVQIFDKDMNVVDSWTQFGRPSGIWILKDDTLIVSDSESNNRIGGPDDGWIAEVLHRRNTPRRSGRRRAGQHLRWADAGCDVSKSGGCLPKFVKK
jgi:DNA-binding beta-propeller fold protein YncE